MRIGYKIKEFGRIHRIGWIYRIGIRLTRRYRRIFDQNRIRMQATGNKIRIDLWIGKIHTYYYKSLSEYQQFVDYLLYVWLKVERG